MKRFTMREAAQEFKGFADKFGVGHISVRFFGKCAVVKAVGKNGEVLEARTPLGFGDLVCQKFNK